jgi:hypothetical protein
VKAERQKRNPEKMKGVEGTDLDGTTRPSAGEAIVIAKSEAFGAELVDPVEDDQDDSRWTKL